MSVCLNMIVKDEEKILERCLASVAPWIDHWVIADTGSTDRTPELIETFFAERGIPGRLVRFPFENFEQARNQALDAARAVEADFDYLLLTDADMELVVDDEDFRSELKQPAHLVRQVAGIEYDNVRFVHRKLPARYVGVTHEYLDTKGLAGEPRIRGAWFLDHGEGSSRNVKTKRDAKLLRDALKTDPDNARYMFYLAQTYKDMERFEEAIRWYERRVKIGGWAEEVWYAAYMIAFCEQQLGHTDRFIARALEAYQMRPQRAEPLYMLAHHYRERGANELAVLMSEAGERLPKPDDHLFLETFAYDWGFAEEMSIAGFYSTRAGVRQRAYEICNELALSDDAPSRVRSTASQNTVHYAVPGKVAFGSSYRAFRLALEPAPKPRFVPMNPTIALDTDGSILANVRWVNYRIGQPPPGGFVKTRNEIVRLDLDGGVSARVRSPLIDTLESQQLESANILGYEDLRLFRWRERWWATCTVRDRRPDGLAEIALLELEIDPALAAPSRVIGVHVQRDLIAPGQHQKNWVPLVRGNDLLLIYEADPTLVLKTNPMSLRAWELSSSTPDLVLKTLRGSSQAVPFIIAGESGYLYVAHEAFDRKEGRVYTHRLVWLDADLVIRHVSDPFFFIHRGVEFCAGLVVRPGRDVVMSFGLEDREPWFATAPIPEVTSWLLEPARRRAAKTGGTR